MTDFAEIAQQVREDAQRQVAERINKQAFTLPQSACSDSTETPEEREEFERIYREQQIAAMVEIAGQCSTTSLTGICTKLFEAGCRIEEVKHG